MEKRVSVLLGSSLSLSYLRLLIPPHRLISAAIWQTVDQKIVSDYGLVEEFVFKVTDIVPQLLSTRQRAELIMGLRARLILELCRAEDTAQIQIIQPHLDRMQELEALWTVVTPNAEEEQSESHFMALVKNLLSDSDERRHFFNDVFPSDFGPTYDKAIQTLMWLFLSRLEKILPTQSLQQIASLLGDPSCVLNEYMESFSDPLELKLLLDTYKDISQLDNIDSLVVESGILSALCLPSEERVLIVSAQTEPDAESGVEYTICSEMEVETDDKVYVESGSCEDAVQTQWADLGNEVKSEGTEIVVHSVEGCKDNHHPDKSETLMIGEDGQVSVLSEQAKRRRGRPKKAPLDEDFEVKLTKEQMEDPDFVIGQRPVRKNRGLKMKRLLSQWKRTKTKSSNNTKNVKKSQSSDLGDQTCKVCGTVMANSKLLDSHMSQHADEAPYSCYSCEKVYKSLRFLQRHKCSSVAKDKREQPYADTDDLEKAAEDETEAGDDKSMTEGPFYCPQCSVEFKCRQTFRFHLRNICYDEQQVDPEKTEDEKHCFKCDQCDKAFKYKSTLDSHKQTHNPLYCHACMKLVRDSDALALHKESHTPFQCNHCDENFPVFKALHKHYVDVHNLTEPYTCAHCQTAFVSLKRFIRHEWKHTGYQPFQCSQCVKRFRSYSDLVEHQRKHTKAYPYLCWECGKKFRHSLTLTRHVARVHHSGEAVLEKPPAAFGCHQCGKMFTSRRCLLKHDNFHHKGLRFPCEFCGKGFFGKDALVRHTLIHTGERPFKCDDCDKSFRSLAELKIHRRYHTGERPFKCTVCQKGFVQSCFLTLHMRSHTGERPYVCAVCSKGFTSLHGLKRHRRLVHT
ncbi:uncharacterized protein [Eucyclogobius newberryi]|uniref:uncharacterized protein n=1 Tax=Eucyclogobius newberryi TaxID=166745 RepID=UPI003B592D30